MIWSLKLLFRLKRIRRLHSRVAFNLGEQGPGHTGS